MSPSANSRDASLGEGNDATVNVRRLLVAVPCLNEAETIGHVLARVPRAIPGLSVVDLLVVDDGSTDNTASLARAAGAVVLSHGVNRGVGRAFQNALAYAVSHGYDLMVNIDGDGQFRPEDIPLLVAPVLSGHADMVTASRFLDPSLTPAMPVVKRYGNYLMSWLISQLTRTRYADVSCGFRCYSRDALLHLNLHGAFTYTQETFLDFAAKGLHITEVPIAVQYFEGRQSRVAGSIAKYATNTAKIIFRSYRDYFPLRFFASIALVWLIPGLLLGGLFIAHFIRTGRFSGYLFAGFGSGFCLLLSLLFLILGIVTDMLDRLRVNQDRILYLLKKQASR